MKHFEGCATAVEVNLRYRELAKKHHPDLGGDLREMQEINRQRAEALRALEDRHDPVKNEERMWKERAAEQEESDFASDAFSYAFGGFQSYREAQFTSWTRILDDIEKCQREAHEKRLRDRNLYRMELLHLSHSELIDHCLELWDASHP